jgi:tRNA C32,U32 (ribose-2'-O)-methylase TrmJ
MTHRIVVNVQTGETTQVDLTAEEIAQAQASHAAWVIAEAQKQSTPTLEETIQSQAATITALTARIVALETI